ncbi:uncharacterized protein PG986_002103 [Apiospora aurea]|uniref:Uncharacterized protein n=1 Tax=Apiospora aurea TaxID=335848 RepID=A0ABR1QYP1_9PEZI
MSSSTICHRNGLTASSSSASASAAAAAAAASSSQPTTARKSKKNSKNKSKSHCLRVYLQQPESRLIVKSNAGTTAVAAAASHAISKASSEAKMSRDIKKIMGPFERG